MNFSVQGFPFRFHCSQWSFMMCCAKPISDRNMWPWWCSLRGNGGGGRGRRVIRVLIKVGVSVFNSLSKLLQLMWERKLNVQQPASASKKLLALDQVLHTPQEVFVTVIQTCIWWPDFNTLSLLWVSLGTPQPTSPTLADLGAGWGHVLQISVRKRGNILTERNTYSFFFILASTFPTTVKKPLEPLGHWECFLFRGRWYTLVRAWTPSVCLLWRAILLRFTVNCRDHYRSWSVEVLRVAGRFWRRESVPHVTRICDRCSVVAYSVRTWCLWRSQKMKRS